VFWEENKNFCLLNFKIYKLHYQKMIFATQEAFFVFPFRKQNLLIAYGESSQTCREGSPEK